MNPRRPIRAPEIIHAVGEHEHILFTTGTVIVTAYQSAHRIAGSSESPDTYS